MFVQRRQIVCSTLAVVLLAGTSVSVQAQDEAVGAEVREAADVAAGRAAIERAREAYLALESYADQAEVTYFYHPRGGIEQAPVWNITTKFVAPASLALVTDEEAIYTDSEMLYKVLVEQKQFIQESAPSEFDTRAYTSDLPSGGWLLTPVGVVLLRQEENPPMLLRTIQEVTGSEPAEQAGVDGILIRARGLLNFEDPNSPRTDVEMFIRDEDSLITYISIDATDAYNERNDEWERIQWTYDFSEIETNIEIDASAFAPPEEFAQVETFERRRPSGRASQMALIGQPAPHFEGIDHKGEPISLADYEGKIVVLDFWAMWCGPCVAALPHVQKLHEQFKDKPVVILGVNMDRTSPERVAEFAEEREITFRHYMDDGEAGEAYRIRGIPAMVIIDKDGMIQDVSTGFPPGKEKTVAEQIERLLAGENLRSEEELAELRAQLEAEATRPQMAYTGYEEERLESSRFSGAFGFYSRHMTHVMDVTGDGKLEVVTAGNEGDIEIIDSTGQRVERIRFPGGARARISELAPVFINGERHWAVTWMGMTETSVGFYTDSGEEIWTFTPDPMEGAFVQAVVAAGDVTADGEPEIIVGLSAMRRDGDGLDFDSRSQAGAVIVLSRSGERLVQRPTGSVDFLFVGEPAEAGEAASILYATRGRLQRMTFNSEAVAEAEP